MAETNPTGNPPDRKDCEPFGEAVRLLEEARYQLLHSDGHVACIGCELQERIDAFLARIAEWKVKG